jgi:cyclophilin family peptidyl-prolyl cis-trans isomerase
MVKMQISVLGYDLPMEAPETVEEFDTLAKRAGACLAESIANVTYRGVSPQIRSLFTEGVEKQTGKKFKTKTVPTGEKDTEGNPTYEEVVDESEGRYFSRVLAELVSEGKYPSEEAARGSFESIALEAASKVRFDPSVTISEPKAKKPSKAALATIDLLISKGSTAEVLASRLTAKLREVNPQRSDVGTSREDLALAFMEHERNQAAARRAAEVAALSGS